MRRLLLLTSSLAACQSAPTPEAVPCGGARAGVIASGDWRPEGPDALAADGDVLLANPDAAFVVQGPDAPRTYYHYGGTPIDAVPLRDCAQVAPDLFGELGFTPGTLDLFDLPSSVLRQFRGDRVEVIADGSDGGAAHVRVSGVDDRFWLVDFTLTADAAGSDRRRPLSGPMEVAWAVDYRLPPSGRVLEMTVEATNLGEEGRDLLVGLLAFPSARTSQLAWGAGEVSAGGLRLVADVPWLTFGAPEVGYALAIDGGGPSAYTEISGANVFVDPSQVLGATLAVGPAGEGADTARMRAWLAVGEPRAQGAVSELLGALPEARLDGLGLREVSGAVLGSTCPPWVEVEAQDAQGDWRVLTRVGVDASGRFEARIPSAWPTRLVARDSCADPSVPTPLAEGPVTGVSLDLTPTGRIRVAADDGEAPLAVRVTLEREDGASRVLRVPPEGLVADLAVGAWTAHLTRGFEHAPTSVDVDVRAGEETPLTASLPRLVDTEGWISVDGHVHASPSADSDVLPTDRFATVATEGVEVMIGTDHEVITDFSEALADSPWRDTMRTVVGEEVTATVPEHLNMWGVPLGPEDGVRGDPVVWYGLGLGGLYDAMRARGAGVVQLNHPGWMDDIAYDVLTGEPQRADPTLWGLGADQTVWSWDFDAIELQNGFKYIWGEADRPGTSGLFRSWASFHNLGHRITAVGVSDAHGLDRPGDARTYVAVPDDALDAFTEAPLLSGVLDGRAIVSTGAFAQVGLEGPDGARAGLGETLTSTSGAIDLEVAVRALPGIRVDRAVVFVNCDAVAEVPADAPDAVDKLQAEVPLSLTQDAWIAVAAFGSGAYPAGMAQPPSHVARVLTNPMYVDVDGNGRFDPPGGRACDLDGRVPDPG